MAAALPVVGAVAGGLISSSGSRSAAKSQERAAQQAADAQIEAARISTDEIARQYDLSRQDQAPWRDTGASALNRLATLMGIVPTGTYGSTPAPRALTEAEIRQELLPQFSGSQASTGDRPALGYGESYAIDPRTGQLSVVRYTNPGGHGEGGTGYENEAIYTPIDGQGGGIDEDGLNAAVQQRLAQQRQQQQQWQSQQTAARSSAQSDPQFGSLMRRFTMDDYVEDPGYQFRLGQGEQAINRAAAAAGRYDSGRALKDLTEFNSGLASQEYGSAYSRFVNDQSNQYNRLANLAGVGQTAANTLSELGANAANSIAGINQSAGNAAAAGAINSGNARASGYMGQSNAWNNAIGGATNALAQYFSTPSLNIGPGFNLNASMGSGISNPTFSARW